MIVSVAIKFKGMILSMPCPNRHHNILHTYYDATGCKLDSSMEDQGFLTSEGLFVGREAALKIARDNKQLRLDREVIGERLYSENLW